jgi:uncharacterized protein (DUF1684 family)
MIRYSLAAVAAAAVAALPLAAQDAPYHMRGTLEAVNGANLTIAADDGMSKSVTLNDDAGVFVVDNATIDDIKRGQFVGITSVYSQGQAMAIEVHIFEEALRGLAEGHYPWDLVDEPNMMTNAGIAKLDDVGDGQKLTVTYVEGDPTMRNVGTQQIVVPPDAKVVNFFAADRSALKPGAHVFLLAVDTDSGIRSPAIVVGRNGVEPPM